MMGYFEAGKEMGKGRKRGEGEKERKEGLGENTPPQINFWLRP